MEMEGNDSESELRLNDDELNQVENDSHESELRLNDDELNEVLDGNDLDAGGMEPELDMGEDFELHSNDVDIPLEKKNKGRDSEDSNSQNLQLNADELKQVMDGNDLGARAMEHELDMGDMSIDSNDDDIPLGGKNKGRDSEDSNSQNLQLNADELKQVMDGNDLGARAMEHELDMGDMSIDSNDDDIPLGGKNKGRDSEESNTHELEGSEFRLNADELNQVLGGNMDGSVSGIHGNVKDAVANDHLHGVRKGEWTTKLHQHISVPRTWMWPLNLKDQQNLPRNPSPELEEDVKRAIDAQLVFSPGLSVMVSEYRAGTSGVTCSNRFSVLEKAQADDDGIEGSQRKKQRQRRRRFIIHSSDSGGDDSGGDAVLPRKKQRHGRCLIHFSDSGGDDSGGDAVLQRKKQRRKKETATCPKGISFMFNDFKLN